MQITVAIPVRNEEQSIRQLLDALTDQTLLPSEIVIADTGSTDRTCDIVSTYEHKNIPVRLIKSGQGFPGRARNLAAAAAAHEWIAFVDAGTKPELNWLESLAAAVKAGDAIDVVYGTYEPVTDTLLKQCSVMVYVAPPSAVDGKLIRARSIASAMMKRQVWQAVSGFPEDLRSAEDLLFMNRIERAGFRVTRAPDALVHWQVQPSLWGLFRRFVKYSRNNVRAGLWRNWQAAIFRRYGLLILSALPAIFLGARWLLVTLALWFGLLAARAIVAIHRNRECYPAGPLWNLIRLCVLVPVLAVLDSATIIGTIEWIVRDRMRISGQAAS